MKNMWPDNRYLELFAATGLVVVAEDRSEEDPALDAQLEATLLQAPQQRASRHCLTS